MAGDLGDILNELGIGVLDKIASADNPKGHSTSAAKSASRLPDFMKSMQKLAQEDFGGDVSPEEVAAMIEQLDDDEKAAILAQLMGQGEGGAVGGEPSAEEVSQFYGKGAELMKKRAQLPGEIAAPSDTRAGDKGQVQGKIEQEEDEIRVPIDEEANKTNVGEPGKVTNELVTAPSEMTESGTSSEAGKNAELKKKAEAAKQKLAYNLLVEKEADARIEKLAQELETDEALQKIAAAAYIQGKAQAQGFVDALSEMEEAEKLASQIEEEQMNKMAGKLADVLVSLKGKK